METAQLRGCFDLWAVQGPPVAPGAGDTEAEAPMDADGTTEPTNSGYLILSEVMPYTHSQADVWCIASVNTCTADRH